jgi:uncharacterized delta-60 repeat protein
MWFSVPRKTRVARSAHNTFRPRLEALEDRCLLSAGALDPTFGSGGTVTTGLVVFADVVEPNGKIVLGGSDSNGWTLERFNPDGSVDTAFGTGGAVHAPSAFPGSGQVRGLAIDANNKIVAIGYASIPLGGPYNFDQEFAVVRYNADGSLDSTFGNGGVVLTNVNPYHKKQPTSDGYELALGVAIQKDGKIDVGGVISLTALGRAQFTLVRYNADGTLDSSFGNQSPKDGISISAPFGGGPAWGDLANAIALQADGNILLVGATGYANGLNTPTMAVARYLGAGAAAGQLDTSFGTGGIVTLRPPGAQAAEVRGVLVQSNGTIVLGAYASVGSASYGTLVRLQSSGQLDTTFANSGFAASGVNMGYGLGAGFLAQGANGDLLLEGITTTNQSVAAVEAYLPGGAVDTSFGNGGIAAAPSRGVIATQPDGKIVLAGFNDNTMNRLLPSNTQIGWPTASPNPASAGTSVTLTASNIYDNAYPSTTVTQVSFYRDTNGNGTLDGTDLLLGTVNAGVWSITVSTTGWAKGTYTLFAQAYDGSGYYAPISIQVTVF